MERAHRIPGRVNTALHPAADGDYLILCRDRGQARRSHHSCEMKTLRERDQVCA